MRPPWPGPDLPTEPSPTPRPSTADSFIGRTVAGVRVERLLGQGSMAEVILGYHTGLKRPVAIKILYAQLRDDPTLMKMLQAEAASLVAMKHPNIVHCVDCNVIGGRPYIVMDLLDGITLRARLEHLKAQGLLPPLHVVDRVIHSAAAALDHAHDRGIVHRDLKPANMMLIGASGPLDASLPLPQDVQVVLTDFGVAHLMEATDNQGMVVGTPAYMSPEQGSGGPVDARSDIYSLRVILYQMLSGHVPFGGADASVWSILTDHANCPPPPVPNLPSAVREVADRALAKHPDGRYLRAGELAVALRRAVESPRRHGVRREQPSTQ